MNRDQIEGIGGAAETLAALADAAGSPVMAYLFAMAAVEARDVVRRIEQDRLTATSERSSNFLHRL